MQYMGGNQQSKHYNQHAYFKSEYNLDKKRQSRNDQSGLMSPVRDVSNVGSGHRHVGASNAASNKQKWEALQRKISALRVENDELKKTLLYE